MNQYSLSLFDPNTLLPHRAGIAGLALALSAIEPEDAPIEWKISEESVSLSWECSDKEALEWLMKEAYIIQDGLLVAPALNLAEKNRYPFSKGVLETFLQFQNGNKDFEEREEDLAYTIEDVEVQVKNRPLLWCYYTETGKLKPAFTTKGNFTPNISLSSKHLPGLIQDFANSHHYQESPAGFLALLFLPLACSYFQLPFVKARIRRKDRLVPTYAVVIPEVTNLTAWVNRRKQLSGRIYRNFRTLSTGESGLRVLLQEKLFDDFDTYRVKSCEVYRIGPQPWDEQQTGLKQAVYRISVDDEVLKLYQVASQYFRPQKRKKENGESWIAFSKVLPWIADNLVAGYVWHSGFHEFAKKRTEHEVAQTDGRKEKPRLYRFERQGLIAMTEHLQPHERLLFDAVQGAFSNYLRGQFKFRRDKVQRELTQKERFDEFESSTDKVVYRLQRPNTQQDFAAALVDFLSQFRSKAARGVGREIYAWIHGSEWRKARDLTMLAIATYQGKGKDGVPEVTNTDEIANLPQLEAETESEEYTESL